MKVGKNLILIHTQILIKIYLKFLFPTHLLKRFDSLKKRPSNKINFGGHMGALLFYLGQ